MKAGMGGRVYWAGGVFQWGGLGKLALVRLRGSASVLGRVHAPCNHPRAWPPEQAAMDGRDEPDHDNPNVAH